MEENNKPLANRTKILRKILTISGIVVLGLLFYLIISALTADGVKSFYCLSDEKCVTVWKRTDGEIYIVPGKFESRKEPTDDYVKVLNSRFETIHLIFLQNGKLLIDLDENATVIKQNSNRNIELYKDNKPLNDSLYTYFDGKYNRYKNEVDFISINIEKNYATDKNGTKFK